MSAGYRLGDGLWRFCQRRLLGWILALTVLLCGGCAPLINRPGEPTASPMLGTSHFVAADGAVMPVRTWLPQDRPAQAVIVALHGFNDYSRFFAAPGQFLSRHGIACYAYDQRGFGNAPGRGLWPGINAYVDDLHTFIGQLRARHPGIPLYVLGESMGGAVAIVALTSGQPPAADGLILAAPAVWGRSTMPWYQRLALDTTARTLPWLRLTGSGLKRMASDNIEMLRGLGRDPLVIKGTRVDAMYGLANLMDAALANAKNLTLPTLVLYGEQDQIIPKEPVKQMLDSMAAYPQTRTALYPQGYHLLLRDLQAEIPWTDITAWIANQQSPLPSGAEIAPKPQGWMPDETSLTAKIWPESKAAR